MPDTTLPSEFSGRTREVYEVRITLTVRREVEHKTEGWIRMPASSPVEINSVQQSYIGRIAAETIYSELKAALLAG